MTQVRINGGFGEFAVEALDNNNVWVLAEPGNCEYPSASEAQNHIDGMLDATWDDDEQYKQVASV